MKYINAKLQYKEYITDFLSEYAACDPVRMHMPGHGGELGGFLSAAAPYDITEIHQSDNLYDPKGIILKSQMQCAEIFHSKYSCYSAGGASQCVKAALYLAKILYGDCILMDRNSHMSAVNALALVGANQIWMDAADDESCISQIKNTLVSNTVDDTVNNVRVIYVTSPDYYGKMLDIENISKLAHEYGAILIVDNAHGSHLNFTKIVSHPISMGADIVIDSLHKTTPALTGAAILHINTEIEPTLVQRAMSLFGSSSPSYLILSSIEQSIGIMYNEGHRRLEFLTEQAEEIRRFAKRAGILVPHYKHCDNSRLTLEFSSFNITGYRVREMLERKNIYPEMADKSNVVFIFTFAHTRDDTEKIISAIDEIIKPLKMCENKAGVGKNKAIKIIPVCVMSVRQAVFSKQKRVAISEAKGKIAASPITPYPPGVPIVMPGEIIPEHLDADFDVDYNMDLTESVYICV